MLESPSLQSIIIKLDGIFLIQEICLPYYYILVDYARVC